jgi:hypothetical protein
MDKTMTKREYFSFPERDEQFNNALTEYIQILLREKRAQFMPPENEMHFSHGIKWVEISSNSSDEESEMKAHKTEAMISLQDIREHNLAALSSFITDIVKQMHQSMQKMVYKTLSESCDKTGNWINAKDYETTADAFLASLKKIEFGVDREGKVSLPEFHLNPQAFTALKKDADAKGVVFQKEFDKVKQEKSEAALEREKQRISRFKT